MCQEEQTGEETSVVLVHNILDCYICKPVAEYLEKIKCKVEQFCLSGHFSSEPSLLFKSRPSEGNVLLVFILPNCEWSGPIGVTCKYLLKTRPDLRRVILSPHPQGYTSGHFPSLKRGKREKFNNELEQWCAENITNFRILHPDSLPRNEYDWINTPKHVLETVAKMILDLATNPETKNESHVESSKPSKVRTKYVSKY
jgi:hypothetical protein